MPAEAPFALQWLGCGNASEAFPTRRGGRVVPDAPSILHDDCIAGHRSACVERVIAGIATRIDPDTIMVHTDYRYRLLVAKTIWAEVARELADEIDQGNFKNQAECCSHDDRYVDALHAVRAVMERWLTHQTGCVSCDPIALAQSEKA